MPMREGFFPQLKIEKIHKKYFNYEYTLRQGKEGWDVVIRSIKTRRIIRVLVENQTFGRGRILCNELLKMRNDMLRMLYSPAFNQKELEAEKRRVRAFRIKKSPKDAEVMYK